MKFNTVVIRKEIVVYIFVTSVKGCDLTFLWWQYNFVTINIWVRRSVGMVSSLNEWVKDEQSEKPLTTIGEMAEYNSVNLYTSS